jgi:hypothetical protein
MTTIVVHGTLAYGSSWYQSSWGERGFLAGLHGGMMEAGGGHDIWSIRGEPVESYPALGGVFEWNGLAEGIYRGVAASALVQYLNAVTELTDEPIRIIAHSHGCNVVKLASSLRGLSPAVTIDRAVFLACPHFYEDEYTQEALSWQDRLDIRKVAKSYKVTGRRYRYRVDPSRFGRILNVYCEKDKVQVDLAQSLSGGQVPLTGGFLENVLKQLSEGMHEIPKATRRDLDEQAVHLYENLEVHVERGCSGVKTHSVMHGSIIGLLAGMWLNSRGSVEDLLRGYGDLPALSCSDTGD